MANNTELKRLEEFVEKLLAKFSELKKEKEQLEKELQERQTELATQNDTLTERDTSIAEYQETIKAREQEIAALKGDISTQESERDEISLQVNKIVDQIQEWELSLEKEEQGGLAEDLDAVVEADEEDEDLAGTASANEVEEEKGSEEEGRVQHNLFSMSDS